MGIGVIWNLYDDYCGLRIARKLTCLAVPSRRDAVRRIPRIEMQKVIYMMQDFLHERNDSPASVIKKKPF